MCVGSTWREEGREGGREGVIALLRKVNHDETRPSSDGDERTAMGRRK